LAENAAGCHFRRTPIMAIQRKGFKMRDEIDGRMWVAHHDQFSEWVGTAAAAVRAGLHRLGGWDGSVHQLLALAAAFALTALNLGFTSSAA
jgi:hypothetical protein